MSSELPSHVSYLLALTLALPFAACSSDDDDDNGGGGGGAGLSLTTEVAAQGLTFPVFLTSPAGDARLFIVEKGGTIVIVENGVTNPVPFLDITPLIATGDEQGLLALAFPADYATTGRFYVSYSDAAGGNVVARYTVSAVDPNQADATTAEPLLTVAQKDEFHNGGMIAFGPDGNLWISRGDGNGAVGGDPAGNGQSLDDLLGALLRIDVSAATGYTIPADNPYVNDPAVPDEIYSYGLRNPWRFSFDRVTGELYIADVGQGDEEEVDVTSVAGASAANFGWNIMEGSLCFEPAVGCSTAGLTLPVHTYSHDAGHCAITGGYVYRGSAIPTLAGTYFFGDFCASDVQSFVLSGGQATQVTAWPSLSLGSGLTSFGQDANGELYILMQAGTVYRIIAN
jgi:glucose/arabinose dehydrogenase